ncbi:PREDICTED: uncharacterized protein LOC109160947 [Ipomoea nil]|uniref:uncharacterized protein LOC109160947 n=1 Tax=Ipomoea nil TaxID=35883 RepID=UPI000901F8D0|nr:PREDICTED: uncharacterized protein LOC109160947 [Ipomoea nil]
MGNCQAVDAAALVIQHPTGKIERMYCPILASEIMKLNPGHYVSLIIPLPVAAAATTAAADEKTVRFTRVKLLRPNDTLVLGRAYRLVTTQDVMKVLRAKKYAKMKKKQQQQEAAEMSEEKLQADAEEHSSSSQVLKPGNSDSEKAVKNEIRQRRGGGLTITAAAGSRSKSWRPSLDSITESGS